MALPLEIVKRDPVFEARLKQHIRATHYPESFAGLNWNQPVSKEPPEFVFEFHLNPEKRPERVAVPCTICSHGKPKYFHIVVAWFVREGVYRCIGIDCAARFFGRELVDAQKRKFVKEKTQRIDFNFLFENLGLVPQFIAYFEALMPAVSAVERLRLLLARAHIREALHNLAKERDGRLVVWDSRQIERFNPVTNRTEVTFEQIPTEIGMLTGLTAVARHFGLSTKLRIETDRLRAFDRGDDSSAQSWVIEKAWDFPEDAGLACFRIRHADSFRTMVESKVKDALRFFTVDNFHTLNRLGFDRRSSIQLYASVSNDVFRIGPVQSEAVAIRPVFSLLDRLPSWPSLRTTVSD